MTDQDAEQLAAKLARVWLFKALIGLPRWSYWPPVFRFDALMEHDAVCHLQEDGTFVLSSKRLARKNGGEESLVSAGELRCSLDGEITSAIANKQRGEKQKQFDRFAADWMALFRRNCWLSGRSIDCTEEEQQAWMKWLNQQPRLQTLSAPQARQLEWEGQRIMAAFGVHEETWPQRRGDQMIYSCRDAEGISIQWELEMPLGELYDLTLSYFDYTTNTGIKSRTTRCRGHWEFINWDKPVHPLHERMSRALYCLGFDNETISSQLPHLSAHEKLELRLGLPREFWPQKWLREGDE